MKKLKSKLFYISSFIFYLLFVGIFAIFTLMFIEQNSRTVLLSYFSAVKQGSDDIVEVVVDDESIKYYKYPWGLELYSEILGYFDEYAKPKIIGYDMLPASFDINKSGDKKFLNRISKMDNFTAAFVPQVRKNSEIDNKQLGIFEKKFALNITDKTSSFNSEYNDVMYFSDNLRDANKNYGSVMLEKAKFSGTILNALNIVKIGQAYYPSLSFKMYLMTHSTNEVILDDYYITVPKTGLKIPYKNSYDGVTKTDIRFYKKRSATSPYSHQSLSAYKIIDSYRALKNGITPQNNPQLFDIKSGKYLNPELFKDKIIFIGANLSGDSADVHKTPMNESHPGVDIQASIYDNLIHGDFLSQANFGIFVLSTVLLSLIAFISILRYRFLQGLFLILSTAVLYLGIVYFAASKGYIMSYAVPLVSQLVTTIFGYSFKFITENRNKEKIKQAMGKYLSQDIMKNVVSNIDDLKLGGKRAVVTVLFSDIRGFTSLSEKMSAEEVSLILNEYFAQMEPIITKYNGVINKFIGDAVLAIFGEPIQDINHPQNAVKCAYEMLKKVEYLREKWIYEGKPKIEIGVGINTGEVFIGNIGTETRMEFTVIGDTVNLASRIESYNKIYHTNLLVSESTYSHIADIADVIKISEVQIRGKAKKMNIYEVLRIDKG